MPMPEMQEMCIRSLGQVDSLEEEMATNHNILAKKVSRTEEPGRLQFVRSEELDIAEHACIHKMHVK